MMAMLLKRMGLFLILMHCCFSYMYASISGKTLVFAPLPMQNKKALYETFKPMTLYLEEKLDVKIEYLLSDSYEQMLQSISDGKVDLAYLGPLPFVYAKHDYEAIKPLVFFKEADGSRSYTCSIISWGKSVVPLRDGMKIALTSPLSTCGYLGVASYFLQRGKKLDDFYFKYLGRHDIVALDIVKGKFDMGGVKSTIFHKYKHLGLKEIAITTSFPSFVLAVDSSKFTQEQIDLLQEVMLQSNASANKSWFGSTRYGSFTQDESIYDELKALMRLMGML